MRELLFQQWFVPGRPPSLLATLFPAAMNTLIAEDRALRGLFKNSPRTRELELGEHPGLAYGLFETTLVYLLFKAWLPYVDLEWESRYSDDHRRCCDLVVLSPRLYFEAKWWGSMQGKTLRALANDVQRLREPQRAYGRYLLTFWWNFDEDAPADLQQIEGLGSRIEERGLRPRYYARFPTRVRHKRQEPAHFAMCVFAVS